MKHQNSRTAVLALLLGSVLSAAAGSSHAYGSAAPMGIVGIEAQAPVASLQASSGAVTTVAPRVVTRSEPSRLRNWIAAIKRRLDGATEVAAR